MGKLRDLKKATEAYWGEKISREDLLKEGKRLRLEHWKIQKDAGVDIIPSNDFAFYDQVLDHIQLFGVSDPIGPCLHSSCLISLFRLSQRDTPSMVSTLLMSTSPWAVVCRDPPRMACPPSTFLAWYVDGITENANPQANSQSRKW